MQSAGKPLSPLLLAASRSQSWKDVLRAYTQCQAYLGTSYQPTTAELQHGLSKMPNAWATSIFYYDLVKHPIAPATPDSSLVIATLQRFKEFRYSSGLARVIEEDVKADTLDGAKAKITLAAFTGMWETALTTLLKQPKLRQSMPMRRTVLSVLTQQNEWQRALQVLRMSPAIELHPMTVRRLVRCFGRLRYSDMALRLTAASLAAGYTFDSSLLSALITTLQETGQWSAALEVAQRQQLFSATRAEGRKNSVLFGQLVDCLYEADLYGDVTLQAVVEEVLLRTNPRQGVLVHNRRGGRQFRLRLHAEVFQQFQGVLLPLSHLYSKIIRLPRWYSRSIGNIATTAVADNNTLIVLDTNFLLQLISKNLSMEHFYAYMKEQFADLHAYNFATLVIPFTVLQELYAHIWGNKVRYPLAAKTLLWSRLVALVDQPNVYALSLAGEFPSISLGIIPKLAYHKLPGNIRGKFSHDPDLRILNVCVSLQHYLRMGIVTHNLGGVAAVEGIVLFSLMKYHVRRYCNTVKGSCVDRLLLCTMDRRMSLAAQQLGIRVFPNITEME